MEVIHQVRLHSLQALPPPGRSCSRSRFFLHFAELFVFLQPAGFLVSGGFVVRSPSAGSLTDLGKLRNCLRPFQMYAWRYRRSSIFWWYSPLQLQDAWKCFPQAVATACGRRFSSTEDIHRIRALREANISRAEPTPAKVGMPAHGPAKQWPVCWGRLGCQSVSFEEAAWGMGTNGELKNAS